MKKIFSIIILLFSLLNVRGQNWDDSLFVFIGEKISVEAFPPDTLFHMDEFFKAKYKVLETVYGNFTMNTIEFEVADHYGFPEFATYKNVILYVARHGGKWYHLKYLYTPVYKTVDNKWAGMYQGRDYAKMENQDISIKPEKIQFKDKICIDTTKTKFDFGDSYNPLYYKVKGKKAYPTHGNYVPELFLLKKNGSLKNIGFLKTTTNTR